MPILFTGAVASEGMPHCRRTGTRGAKAPGAPAATPSCPPRRENPQPNGLALLRALVVHEASRRPDGCGPGRFVQTDLGRLDRSAVVIGRGLHEHRAAARTRPAISNGVETRQSVTTTLPGVNSRGVSPPRAVTPHRPCVARRQSHRRARPPRRRDRGSQRTCPGGSSLPPLGQQSLADPSAC